MLDARLKHFLLLFLKIILFIFGCTGSLLLHGLFSSCGAQAFLCVAFSCEARALECSDFNSCGPWSQWL